MNPRPFSYRGTWHELLRTSGGIVLARIGASLAIGALLTSLGLAAAWIQTFNRHGTQKTAPFTVFAPGSTTRPAFVLPSMLRVSPEGELVAMDLVIAGALWLGALYLLWRPRRSLPQPASDLLEPGKQPWIIPITGTLLATVAALLGAWYIVHSTYVAGDQRYLHGVLWTAIGGILLLLWLPALRTSFTRTRELFDLGGQINVRCPRCNYLLVGLKQLRCPECGLEFTIDELIRAQKFAQGAEA
jgi:hypothetical protein